MALNAAPVVDKADDDEEEDHDDLDHSEPVLGLAWCTVKDTPRGTDNAQGRLTVHPHVDELHDEDGCNDDERVLPGGEAAVPVLCTEAR